MNSNINNYETFLHWSQYLFHAIAYLQNVAQTQAYRSYTDREICSI